VFDIFTQVVDAVAHLHKHGLTHNNIKANNVLLSQDGTPKLCDFGLACEIGQPMSGCGTSHYMAPELLTRDGDEAVGVLANPLHDVWSLGVLLFVMLTDRSPWHLAIPGDEFFFLLQANKFKVEGLDRYEQKV
jgi:serine/threonine protein kinase